MFFRQQGVVGRETTWLAWSRGGWLSVVRGVTDRPASFWSSSHVGDILNKAYETDAALQKQGAVFSWQPGIARREPVRLSWSLGAWLRVVRRVADRSSVGLTYDDGPTPETTPALLHLLAEHSATATFFLSGVRAAAHPDLVEAIVAAGHDVYAHGWEHVFLDRFPRARIGADLDRAESLLSRFRPTPSPYLVRLPYNAGFRKRWVHRAIASWRADAELAYWTVSSEDVTLAGLSTGADQLEMIAARRVREMVADPRIGGAVVLLHEKPFDVSGPLSAAIAPVLLRHLLAALSAAGLATARLAPGAGAGVLGRFVLA